MDKLIVRTFQELFQPCNLINCIFMLWLSSLLLLSIWLITILKLLLTNCFYFVLPFDVIWIWFDSHCLSQCPLEVITVRYSMRFGKRQNDIDLDQNNFSLSPISLSITFTTILHPIREIFLFTVIEKLNLQRATKFNLSNWTSKRKIKSCYQSENNNSFHLEIWSDFWVHPFKLTFIFNEPWGWW